MTFMRTNLLLVALATVSGALACAAQEPVLLAGGSTPPTPVVASFAGPAAYPPPPLIMMPITCPAPFMHGACPGPVAYPCAGQVVSGGYYNAPNVLYFGGPNSCYYHSYPGDAYGPGCSYPSPSVIYFGRGEACERGYAFRHYR